MGTRPASTVALQQGSVLPRLATACGCCWDGAARTVGAMNLLHLSPSSQVLQITLEPGQPVLPLQCRPGQRALLEVLAGRVWITQQGRGSDLFLDAGQGLALQGPAVIYASAEGTVPLRLRWAQEADAPMRAPARCTALSA